VGHKYLYTLDQNVTVGNLNMIGKLKHNKAVICIIGLGYVGLTLAEAFTKVLTVIGFDIDAWKIRQLINQQSRANHPTPGISTPKSSLSSKFVLTSDPRQIRRADFIIICVPTPVTASKEPDLSHVSNAARIVGQNMKRGSIVILESTVYPSVTDEIVRPILEQESGLKCGEYFKIAYSPERINPGDKEHTINRITKVVAGMDDQTTKIVIELYRKVTPTVFKARDIKTAEAAKVIENIQRDLNIALMNELSLIFEKMGLNTKDVLEAAATKWNFHGYSPGLVGGHCIPVDPYYLVYEAKRLGYHPQVILAGRAINDYMSRHIAEMTIKALNAVGKVIKGSRVLIMGLTYKENVADIRETPAKGLIKELKEYEIVILGYDPLVDNIEDEFAIENVVSLEDIKNVDCVIAVVNHEVFAEITLDKIKRLASRNPVLIDVRRAFNQEEAERKGFYYRAL